MIRFTDKMALQARIALPELKDGQHAYKFIPAYSGGVLEVDSYPLPVVVNIETVELEAGMNCLLDHQLDKPLGGIVKAKKSNRGGIWSVEATAVIGNTPASREFFALESAGVTQRPSIGLYRTNRFKETQYKHGESFQANGRTFTGPAILIDHGIISEISQVIIGGDIEAKAALIAQVRSKNTMSFSEWLLQEKSMIQEEFDALPPEEQATLQAEYDAIQAACGTDDPKHPPVKAELDGFVDDEAFYAWLTTKEITPEDYQAMDDAGKTALQEEYLAMQASSKSVVQAAIKTAELSKENQTEIVRIRALEAGFKHSPEFLAEALDKKWSFNTARKILTARLKSTNQQKALNAQVKTGKPMKEEMKGDVFLAGFGREFGLTDKNIVDKLFYGQKHRAEPALEAAARQFRQGCGYAELFLSSINSHDRKLDSYHMEQSHEQSRQNRLKSKNPALTASLGFSTIDAQAIIDHVHQTYVEQQYELAEFTAENIGTIREVSDFTKIEMFKPTLLGRIKQIADSGEIPHMSFTIEARTAQSKPLGGILAVPETYYINDDIGLFKDTMNMLAQEAAIAYENDFFEYLRLMMNNTIMAADGQSFFSTARNNYLTGAQSSFSTLGLSNARLQFSKMKNKNDAPILVNPTNLIVPPALEPKAQLIFQSNRTNEGGNEGEAQIYGGKYNPITSPFLGTGMTGNPGMISDTAWLLTAAQNALALIYILKVRGFGSPRLESSTMDISVWGTKYRVLFPYGFAVGDPNAAVLSTGV